MEGFPRFYFPTRVYSGAGCVARLLDFVGPGDAVFLMTDATLNRLGLAPNVAGLLRGRVKALAVYDKVLPDPAVEMVCEAAEEAHAFGATTIVCVGGGSVMDAAKAVAMLVPHFPDYRPYAMRERPPRLPSLPCYAVPTTCGTGAEASSAAVLSYQHVKGGIKAETMFMAAAFLDEALLLGLPASITAQTAMDALTHAVESYIGRCRQPMLDALNLHAVRLLFRHLPAAYADGSDLAARAGLLQAACMAGLAMGHSGTGIVHAFSNKLCEAYPGLPHGLCNAILLPYCLRYNAPAALGRLGDIAAAAGLNTAALGEEAAGYAAVEAIERLGAAVHIPRRISGQPLAEAQIQDLAEGARTHFIAANNPRTPTREDLAGILRQALPL